MTNTRKIRGQQQLYLALLLLLSLLLPLSHGATVTWGYVNKYVSTLYAQDVYLGTRNVTTDIVYKPEDNSNDSYTITAVHAYDMTMPTAGNTPTGWKAGDAGDAGDASSAMLLEGGIGQDYVIVRFQRHPKAAQLTMEHYKLVIYGLEL